MNTTTIEVSLTPEQKTSLGTFRQWMHEATRQSDGARLYTAVAYRHTTRGDWKSALIHADGTVERLDRIPKIPINAQAWTLTPYGESVRLEGRQ